MEWDIATHREPQYKWESVHPLNPTYKALLKGSAHYDALQSTWWGQRCKERSRGVFKTWVCECNGKAFSSKGSLQRHVASTKHMANMALKETSWRGGESSIDLGSIKSLPSPQFQFQDNNFDDGSNLTYCLRCLPEDA